jgi:Tfp pilus assembly pilus retraction ATPase PilT
MYSVLETSKQDGMVLMDDDLISLYKRGAITLESVKNSIRDFSRVSSFSEV